jgi:hypothetical protein
MERVPYNDTSVPEERSRGQVTGLLVEAGVLAIQWTDTPGSIKGIEMPVLQFAVVRELRGVQQKFVIRIQTPLLEMEKGRGYSKKKMPNRNASMRLLYWYVKSKLEAIQYGLEDFVEAFMPRILISLPNGRTETMADALKNSPQILSQVMQLPEIEGSA